MIYRLKHNDFWAIQYNGVNMDECEHIMRAKLTEFLPIGTWCVKFNAQSKILMDDRMFTCAFELGDNSNVDWSRCYTQPRK
jgi:hypothetical protein